MVRPLDLEAQRLENLRQKQKLLDELDLNGTVARRNVLATTRGERPPVKKRRLDGTSAVQRLPARTSARIAANATKISYDEDHQVEEIDGRHKVRNQKGRKRRPLPPAEDPGPSPPKSTSTSISRDLPTDLPSLIQHYNSWTPSAALPTFNSDTNTYHFPSHPHFTPNKSPLSILQEGAFGGSYFSPWRSQSHATTLENDYLTTLPADWLSQLQPPEKYLISPTYRPELNKHGVQCGQTLAQWEESGWINFNHDARGWFEWYIRFWLGRRLEDGEDERQVGRWMRCVGERGRWKRMLLKKYVEMGVRSVFDDDEGEEEEMKVSPVMHQTCLHWACQVTQEDLDEAWRGWPG